MAEYCIKQLWWSLILALGSATFGYIIGYPSPTMPDMREEFGDAVPEIQYTIFNAITSLTAIGGPFVVKLLVSPQFGFGRRTTCFIVATTGTSFWLLLLGVSADRFWIAILSRALSGLTMGGFSALVPMYIVELAPPESTGFFGSIHQTVCSSGIVVIYLVGSAVHWRTSAVIGASITAALSVLLWLVPESPAVAQQDRMLSDQQQGKAEIQTETVFSKKWFSRTMAGCSFLFFQQLTGISAIVSNLADIFQDVGVSLSPGYASAISGSAKVLACCFAGFLVQKFGRKVMWTISFGGIAICDLLFALFQHPKLHDWFPEAFPIGVIFLTMMFFGLGAGPLPWFLVPERFPTSIRATAQAMATASNWIFAFAVIFLFPVMNDGLGKWASFLVFSIVTFAATAFGVAVVTEPVLEELQESKKIYEDLATT
jgi:MFS family permease